MNPIDIIKDDHERVAKLFKDYEGSEPERKRTIVADIIGMLTMHADMEETIVYPVLRAAFEEKGDQMVGEAYAEHAAAKAILEELKTLEPSDSEYDGKVKALKEIIEHHVREEENDLLPKAKDTLTDDQLRVMGEEMTSFRAART